MWEVLVPANENGKEIPVKFHREWDAKVNAIAGGLTIYKTTKGIWTSPEGEKYHDIMIPVRIICTKKEIDIILTMTLVHYKGERVILAYRVSDKVIMKYRRT